MASTISIPAPSGVGAIRIRDRRRTRRPPRGAILQDSGTAWRSPAPPRLRAPASAMVPAPAGWLTRDDARQFAMSFATFFTAAMVFLA